MRDALIRWLVNRAYTSDNILLITGDLGYSVLDPFIDVHTNQFLNAGVAEQNMAGLAAGLSLEGFRPYIYSIGIFPTFRCAEQIRNDIDYHKLPVVICAVGSGVAYGNLGYSHHVIQDLSLMRSLPNMLIATPSGPDDLVKILDYQFAFPTPLYLRLHKSGEKALFQSHFIISPGEIYRLWPSFTCPKSSTPDTICILCVGHIVSRVIDLCEDNDFPCVVYTVPLGGSSSQEFYFRN